jgi:hypothetical protein
MGYRIDLGQAHQINSSGVPLSGALLYVYQNTTTTPITVYSDFACSSTAANPIVADASGRIPRRYATGPGPHTLVLKTSAGVTLWSDDNIYAFGGDNTALGIDVKGQGAIGDGTTNDRAAIAAADTAALALSPPRAVFFPPGDYAVSSNLTISSPIIMARGARLKPAVGVTITLNGTVYAPEDAQIFTGSGSIAGTGGFTDRVYPRWFGAAGDGSTADDTPVWASEALARAFGCTWDGGRDAGLVYKLTSLKSFSAGAYVFKWENIKFSKPAQTATTFEWAIDIFGPAFGSAITLSSNVAVGASSIALSSATGVSADDVFLLVSDAEYAQSYDAITIAKTEWIRCRSIASTTLTTADPIKSSHTTANNARIFEFSETCEIHFKDVEIVGGGSSLSQGGIRITRGTIHRMDNAVTVNNEYTGFTFNICRWKTAGSWDCSGSDLSGYGYGVELIGCDHPAVLRVTGRKCRHILTLGASVQTTMPDASNIYIMGRGASIGSVSCEDATGSVFDVHVGHVGGVVESVSGTLLGGTTQEAVTIESPDWHIGLVKVTGADLPITVQHYGKPTDEPDAHVSFGTIVGGRGGSSTNPLFLAENKDDDTDTPLYVSVGTLSGDWPGLVTLDCDTGAGSVFAHIGHLRGKSRTTHSILLNSSNTGRAVLTVGRADVTEDSNTSNIYAVDAEGATYENANAGSFGAVCSILSGRIVADNTAFKADDALIRIGTDVEITASIIKTLSGIGRFQVGDGQPGENLLLNGSFALNQLGAATSNDDTYGHDQWIALNESNEVTITTLTDPETGASTGARITQSNAAAKRFGYMQIIESSVSRAHRGKHVMISGRVRCSASTTIRYAVLEWQGTADTVTSDIVNNWSSTTFTAGNFFIASIGSVILDSVGVTANTWRDFEARITGGDDAQAVSSSCNNLIVFMWTDSTQAQNVTLDFNRMKLEVGRNATEYVEPLLSVVRDRCHRFYQSFTVQSENGSRHIPFVARMRATPTVAVGVGSAASITSQGFELTHVSAASCTVTADARL